MRVSVKELLRNFSRLSDLALREPVIITKNGRDRLILLGVDRVELSPPTPGAETIRPPASRPEDGRR